MIYESFYWRKELIKLATKIEKRIPYKRSWTDSQNGDFEREVMIGFYMIRKLKESFKLTNNIIATNIAGFKYPSKGILVTLMNNHRFMELYDFEQPKKDKFNLTFLINQIVHSYIFSPKFDVNRDEAIKGIEDKTTITWEDIHGAINSVKIELTGILFCSDDKRNEFLYELSIKDIINLFRKTGNCNVTSTSRTFNEKKKDYDVIQSDEEIPIPKHILKLIKKSEKTPKKK
jgi:hypothetical protein